ncbi:hypothetical protein ACYSNW_01275 [Enterococcus sp. LJL99]
MKEYSTSEAQRNATKRYEQKNAVAKAYRSKKATAKNFILKTATDEDISLVEEWIAERKNAVGFRNAESD